MSLLQQHNLSNLTKINLVLVIIVPRTFFHQVISNNPKGIIEMKKVHETKEVYCDQCPFLFCFWANFTMWPQKRKKNLVNGLKEIWPLDLEKALRFDNMKGCYRYPPHGWLGLGVTQCN
jgi:hypothetical protein